MKVEKRKYKICSRSAEFIFVILVFLFLFSIRSYAESAERILYEGPVVAENIDPEVPPEYMEKDGKKYQLISSEIKNVKKQGMLTYVSSRIPYELEGLQEAPETAIISITDEATGEIFERDVPRREIIEEELIWSNDFSFPITVYGYGADVFFLGDHELPADINLSECGDLLLEYLELPQERYRVGSVEWSGEPYEQDGMLCRDAMAYGEKLVRHVEVVYGGQVRTPEILAKQYVAVYEEVVVNEKSVEEEMVQVRDPRTGADAKSSAMIQEESRGAETIAQWIKEHITRVVFSGTFLLLIVGWILLLFLSSRKESEKKGKAGN